MDLSAEINPPMWLVFGMEWTGRSADLFAEAAMAVAPTQIPLTLLSAAGRNVVQLCVAVGRELGHRTVFFTDVTAYLDEHGQTWASLGVDWETALGELEHLPVASLYLSLTRRAHAILCWSGRSQLVLYAGDDARGEAVGGAEREAVRAAITNALMQDWPPYAERFYAEHLARGTLRQA
jgi:hypothetical protein